MNRKIIQISVATGVADAPDILYSLCEDGSLWRLQVLKGKEWEKLPDIPNYEPPKSEPKPKMMRCERSNDCHSVVEGGCLHKSIHVEHDDCKFHCILSGIECSKCVEV